MSDTKSIVEKQIRDEIAHHEAFLASVGEPKDFASRLVRNQIRGRIEELNRRLRGDSE